MLQSFCKRILYRWMGFSEVVTETRPEKYIIVMAPHTSNWDFVVGTLYARAEGFQCNFLIKKEWFFWPMGILMRKLGGIPVYRDKKTGSTERLATLAMQSKEFHLCITPEQGVETGILLYRTQGPTAYTALWIGLQKESDRMYKSHHPQRRCGGTDG